MSRIVRLILALFLGQFFLFLLLQAVILPARAIDLTVLNTNDSGAGSLREAIATASDGDTILFDASLNGQTITLTGGELTITTNVTINGPGANLLAISGNNTSRVFLISATVTIWGVTITDGNASEGGGIATSVGANLDLINSTVFNNTGNFGAGGILHRANGTLNLINSTVSSNTVVSDGGSGGGILNDGNLNLINSTISSNTAISFAGSGGGILVLFNGSVTMTNSTVFGNISRRQGGGIHNVNGTVEIIKSTVFGNRVLEGNPGGGGILNRFGSLNLINSTVSSNTVVAGGGAGGGIYNDAGIVNLIYSTVSSNMGYVGGGIFNAAGTTVATGTIIGNNPTSLIDTDCSNAPGATLVSGGYNLVQYPHNCVFSSIGDITNRDPLLGPLAQHGGDTLTHALLNGSPAIEKVPNGINGCGTTITTDQRGVARPYYSKCDIGAYEFDGLLKYYLPLIFKN